MADNKKEQKDTIVLNFEDNEEVECDVLGVFDVDGKEYIALLPLDEGEDVYVFRYVTENDDVKLENIESDDEFNTVLSTFNEIFVDDSDDDDFDDMDFDDDDFDDDFEDGDFEDDFDEDFDDDLEDEDFDDDYEDDDFDEDFEDDDFDEDDFDEDEDE